MLTRVRLMLIRVDSCWFVLICIDLYWYSCIKIDLIAKISLHCILTYPLIYTFNTFNNLCLIIFNNLYVFLLRNDDLHFIYTFQIKSSLIWKVKIRNFFVSYITKETFYSTVHNRTKNYKLKFVLFVNLDFNIKTRPFIYYFIN